MLQLVCRFRVSVEPFPREPKLDVVRFTWLVAADTRGAREILALAGSLDVDGPEHQEVKASGHGRWRRWASSFDECVALVGWVLEGAAADPGATPVERFPNPRKASADHAPTTPRGRRRKFLATLSEDQPREVAIYRKTAPSECACEVCGEDADAAGFRLELGALVVCRACTQAVDPSIPDRLRAARRSVPQRERKRRLPRWLACV